VLALTPSVISTSSISLHSARTRRAFKLSAFAAGSFSAKAVLKKMKLKKISATKYGTSSVYPMSNGMVMTFLDDNTLAFGTEDSLHSALDTKDGKRSSLDANSVMSDQMAAVDGSPLWSILDQKGTQAMMLSAMGDASRVGDIDSLKKRILASSYTMNFASGVNFDLNVLTADSMTAGTLSALFKGVMMYKKMNASPGGKDGDRCDHGRLRQREPATPFQSDDQKFQSLMKSPLFAAVSH
jgi:hypothetical protein